MHLELSSAKRRPFCFGLNVLKCSFQFSEWQRFVSIYPLEFAMNIFPGVPQMKSRHPLRQWSDADEARVHHLSWWWPTSMVLIRRNLASSLFNYIYLSMIIALKHDVWIFNQESLFLKKQYGVPFPSSTALYILTEFVICQGYKGQIRKITWLSLHDKLYGSETLTQRQLWLHRRALFTMATDALVLTTRPSI